MNEKQKREKINLNLLILIKEVNKVPNYINI